MEDAGDISRAFAHLCAMRGLEATVWTDTRVHVSSGIASLSETVILKPDPAERLWWVFESGEAMCPADQMNRAVDMITERVAPGVRTAQRINP